MKKYISTIFLIVIIFGCLAGLIALTVINPVLSEDEVKNPLLISITARGLLCIPLFCLIFFFERTLLRFPRPNGKTLLWLLPCFAVVLVNFPFSALIQKTASIERGELVWLFLCNCLLIALSEEWLFRGLLFSGLKEKSKERSVILPVLLSAALFGLYHLFNLFDGVNAGVFLQVGYTFLLGILFATVLFKTKNMWICIILHFLFDAGGLIVDELGSGNPHDTVFWVLTVGAAVIAAVLIGYTLFQMERKRKENKTA